MHCSDWAPLQKAALGGVQRRPEVFSRALLSSGNSHEFKAG